jgi:hypothetical protein
MRRTILSLAAVLATAMSSSATVTVQAWYHLGEIADYYADATANARRIGSAYSHIPWNNPAYGGNFNGIITPTGVGGPLGNSGYTSTTSLRAGAWGTMICTMWNAAGYAPPKTNYFIEIWVQPHGKGYVYGSSGAWIFAANSSRGYVLRVKDDGMNSYFVGTILEASNVDVGTPVLINTNAWTHLAMVNDNGVTTFYVNGVPSGPSDLTSAVSAPSGDVYFGNPGASTGFDGLMDEARICTFEPGQFSTNDFLLRPPGPQILVQPQSTVVWDGGAAPFAVGAVIDPAVTYQWQREGTNLPGATASSFVVPLVTLSDSGSQFRCILTGGGISVTSSVATLTVAPIRTADVNFYRAAVTGEPSLAAYFTADGCLGTTLTNVVDPTRHGTLEGVVSYDGRTNRAFGQRSLAFTGGGDVQIPNNPAFEFSGGNGTLEALVYLEAGGASDGTIFAWSYDGFSVGYALQASRDGAQLIYSNDSPVLLTWPAPVNLIGRLAHVALVIDNTTNVTAYLDGQPLGTKAQPSLGPANGGPAWIGALGSGAVRRFNGRIDEVAVYNSALSQNTLQVHYSRFVYGTNVSPPSITSQPGSRTVLAGAAPILQVGVSGTLPITYQWYSNGVAVAGANAASHTVVSGAAGTAATYTLYATNAIGWTNSQPITLTFAAAPAGYASAVLQDRPSSYWRLGELSGTLAADSAGYNDATYSGTLTLGQPGAVTTDPDKAVLFGGGSAAAPYTPVLNPATPFTIEFFAKPNVSGQVQTCVIGSQNRSVGRSGYAIYQGLNGDFWEVHMGDASTVQIWLFGSSPVVAGRWYHVALVYTPDDPNYAARIYVNGVDDTWYEESDLVGGFLPNNSVPFTIGNRNGALPFNGTVDEVAFYNYALTGSQISNHWRFSWVAADITQQPASVTTNEWSPVNLTVGASGYPNTFQWYKVGVGALSETFNPDGSRHYPNGVTNATLTISQTHPADSGQYYVVVLNPLGNRTSANATVTITPDTTPPTVAYATVLGTPNAFSGPTPFLVKVGFSEWVDPATAGNAASYGLSGSVSIGSATVGASGKDVFLTTSGFTPGQSYTLTVSGVKDQAQTPNTMSPSVKTVWAPVMQQGLLWDFYPNVANGIANLLANQYYPIAPYTNLATTVFDSQQITGGDLANRPDFGSLGENYGCSLSGWITPTVTTNYYFFLASDDASELYLSPNADPSQAQQIAYESGCCHGFQEPGNPTTSSPQFLQAGVSYFIRALQTEGAGGDYVRVAWKMEGDPTPAASLSPISGSVLSAYLPLPAPRFNAPVLSNGQLTLSWTGTGTLLESSDLVNWSPVAGNPTSPYTVNVTSSPLKFYRLVR